MLDAQFGGAARMIAPRDAGAYSRAGRWVAEIGTDGVTAFVKADRGGGAHVATDARACLLELGSFQPTVYAWLPSEAPDGISVLVTEDLSHARWGVPLTGIDAHALRAALDELAEHRAPDELPAFVDRRIAVAGQWQRFMDDPSALVATGQVDAAWCSAHLERLAAAADTVELDGTGIIHDDTWRQNWCTAERGAVLVDWTGLCRGNPMVNLAWGECGVRACGGPTGIVLNPAHPQHAPWAAWMAGQAADFIAHDFTVNDVRTTRPELWATQARECRAGLVWACTALDLPLPTPAPGALPDGPWQP